MNYKVGDKVRVRTLKDLQKSYPVDDFGIIRMPARRAFTPAMQKYCGQIVTIAKFVKISPIRQCSFYEIKEDYPHHCWTEEMFEEGGITKQAIFYLEKELIKGEEYYRILNWENVKGLRDMPKEYFQKPPYFYSIAYNSILIREIGQETSRYLHRQNVIRKEIWENTIFPLLKDAGWKLHKILKKKKWSGKVEVRI